MKREKMYKIVVKPTTDAFCNGKRTYVKLVSQYWLDSAKKSLDIDPSVERYFVEEIKS